MNAQTGGKPRMAILGARANTTNEKTFTESAAYAKSENVVYVAPGTATKTINGFTKLLNGSTISAALAGICSDPQYNAGEPITGKAFTMFDSIVDPFSGRLQRNRVAQAGVCLIETIDGTTQVRHFLSTDQTSKLTGEAKVAKIKIDTRRVVRQTLNATVINRRMSNETVSLAASLLGTVLSQKVRDGVINAYNIVSILINSVDPTQLDVSVEIKPTLDLDYVNVTETFVIS
jgi:hypothetical protein